MRANSKELTDAINAVLAIAQRENPRAMIILHQLAAALNNVMMAAPPMAMAAAQPARLRRFIAPQTLAMAMAAAIPIFAPVTLAMMALPVILARLATLVTQLVWMTYASQTRAMVLMQLLAHL